MKIVLQRVRWASVTVDEKIIGKINQGLLIFVGIEDLNDQNKIDQAIEKILAMCLWPDNEKGFELNIQQIGGGVLIVSQFTLLADTTRGNRPSFSRAMNAKEAEIIYNEFIRKFNLCYDNVANGKFQAMMSVELLNDGPVTILLDF